VTKSDKDSFVVHANTLYLKFDFTCVFFQMSCRQVAFDVDSNI